MDGKHYRHYHIAEFDLFQNVATSKPTASKPAPVQKKAAGKAAGISGMFAKQEKKDEAKKDSNTEAKKTSPKKDSPPTKTNKKVCACTS